MSYVEEPKSFCFATFVMTVMRFALNAHISREDFTNVLLSPYVCAGRIRKKTGEEYSVNKVVTSRLLNRKDDVPSALRNELGRVEILNDTNRGMDVFVEDYIDQERIEELRFAICSLIRDAKNLGIEDKSCADESGSIEFLLAKALLLAIKVSNVTESDERVILRNGNSVLSVIYGDLLSYGFSNRGKNNCIVVIPVDTAFSTTLTTHIEGFEHSVVSETTLHGKWLKRLTQSIGECDGLDVRIKNDLRLRKTQQSPFDDYPIGSIAVVESKQATFFLLAVSKFDENGNAQSSREEIKIALEKLLAFYDRYGQGYGMYLPLIGTGRSRAHLSLQESYDLITTIFAANICLVNGDIHVIIEPSAKDQVAVAGKDE